MIQFGIKGGKELAALLQQLPVEVETKILRNALARGARVIAEEAKLRVPDDSGALRSAIKTSRNTKQGQVIAKVKLKGQHSYLGVFMEYGVLPHLISVADGYGSLKIGKNYVGGSVEHPGHASRPFMRPALESRAEDAINEIGKYIGSYLQFGTIQAPVISVDEEE